MLETWLSKERLLSNSTPRCLTDDDELTGQPSSVRQCSRFPVDTPLVLRLDKDAYGKKPFFLLN